MISFLSLTEIPSIAILLKNGITILLGLIGIGFLIAFHEMGHFLFCKLFGIRTPSFSIGFGPRLASRQIGDTLFSLSLIPLGGYVEIAGAAEVGQGEQKEAGSLSSDSFATKPYYQKLLVMLGGILFNLILAYVIFTGLFLSGTQKTPLLYPFNAQTVVEKVLENMPASTAGIQTGDRIVAINNTPTPDFLSLIKIISDNPSQNVVITVDRNNTEHTVCVALGASNTGSHTIGTLGVTFETTPIQPHSLITSLAMSAKMTWLTIKSTAQGFTSILKERNINQMAGPIRVIQLAGQGAAAGFSIFLLFLAIISINLAVLNIFPLPILDGGQILFYTLEALFRRSINEKIRIYIHMACWILFIILAVYLTWYDLKRIIVPYFAKP